ncbi:minor capsid protein [Flintibacter sp. HCN-6482]|uniref:minor capsid protein n=1 Tax=Flintibacter sp. HCN-6482 TaxID=3134672 RepID=UPI0030BF0678
MLKFSVHTEGLEAIKDKLTEGCTKAEHTVALQVRKDTSPYVPALTGDLDRRTRVDGSKVIYPGPQSRYLYYGKLMVDPETGSSYAPKGGTKVLTDKDLVFSKAVHGQAQSHWFEASKAENLEKWVRVSDKAVKHDL